MMTESVMTKEELLKKIPENGFLKVTLEKQPVLTDQQKTQLNRKGNVLFNKGEIDQARKIFLLTHYSDGLIRIGDYYWKNKQLYDALKMYQMAPAKEKIEKIIEKMSGIMHKWIKEKE